MEMDFACGTCVWEPNAISTITARTNLPFANGAPIRKLSQHIEILDNNGQVVGTLNTPYAPATTIGNTVTTTTPSAPLVIAEGAKDSIYAAFIGGLNQATTYELGLRGTTDSILDLGVLGEIEIKGIKLDVKSSIAGLQGLKDVKFKSLVMYNIVPGFLDIGSIVTIHNPSKLTLTLGDLTLKAGLDNTEAKFAGHSYLKQLTLVPGDNEVAASVIFDMNLPIGGQIANDLFEGKDVNLALYGFPGSSPNPPLSKGLASLLSSITIPGGMPEVRSALPYNDGWTLTVPPSVMTDNMVEMTATFNNP
ncbi:hypothetical protein BGZ65_012596, partial [Modicella reniformis]